MQFLGDSLLASIPKEQKCLVLHEMTPEKLHSFVYLQIAVNSKLIFLQKTIRSRKINHGNRLVTQIHISVDRITVYNNVNSFLKQWQEEKKDPRHSRLKRIIESRRNWSTKQQSLSGCHTAKYFYKAHYCRYVFNKNKYFYQFDYFM